MVWRILNSPHSPTRPFIYEDMEWYQEKPGLTHHPLRVTIRPPKGAKGITAQILRAQAEGWGSNLSWENKTWNMGGNQRTRNQDIPLTEILTGKELEEMVAYNWVHEAKWRWGGDFCNMTGKQTLPLLILKQRWNWGPKNERKWGRTLQDIHTRITEWISRHHGRIGREKGAPTGWDAF